jgi:hypothetical protein
MLARFNGFALSWSLWHTNHYTASSAMIFCYCLGELLTQPEARKQWLLRYGCGSLGLLLLGTSTGSFFAAGAGSIVAILLSKKGRSLYALLLLVIALTSILVVFARTPFTLPSWIELGQQLKILSPNHSEQPVFSLHGRAILWELYKQDIVASPIFGNGFAISSRLAKVYSSNTHNGFLAILLGTGAIGLIIVIWGAYRFSREVASSRQLHASGTIGCAAALAAAFFNNMSISFIGENWREPSLVFVLFLSLHLFFIRQPRALTATHPRLFVSFSVLLTRPLNAPATSRLRPLAMRRHGVWRSRMRNI